MAEPVRVLQLITELAPGGAERIVAELARGLSRERYAVEVCALRPAVGSVADELRAGGVPVHSLTMRRKWDLGAVGRLARLLRERRIGLVQSHLFHANFLARRALRRLRPGPLLLGTQHICERRFLPWRFWLDRWSLPSHGILVCVSEAVRRFTRERSGIPEAQLRVIPNGVDLERCAGGADAEARRLRAQALRRELGLTVQTQMVLAVGRLDRQKGYPDLLAAWAELGSREAGGRPGATPRPPPRLFIAGEGPERARLERLISRHGLGETVSLLGFRADVPELLAAADVFALASRYEGFGLVLAEAMAAGVPVVATGVDSVPEVLGQTGAGLLVPPAAPRALARALTALLELDPQERAEMGRRGQERARAFFSRERMVSAYAALYEELLARDGAERPAPGCVAGGGNRI